MDDIKVFYVWIVNLIFLDELLVGIIIKFFLVVRVFL